MTETAKEDMHSKIECLRALVTGFIKQQLSNYPSDDKGGVLISAWLSSMAYHLKTLEELDKLVDDGGSAVERAKDNQLQAAVQLEAGVRRYLREFMGRPGIGGGTAKDHKRFLRKRLREFRAACKIYTQQSCQRPRGGANEHVSR